MAHGGGGGVGRRGNGDKAGKEREEGEKNHEGSAFYLGCNVTTLRFGR